MRRCNFNHAMVIKIRLPYVTDKHNDNKVNNEPIVVTDESATRIVIKLIIHINRDSKLLYLLLVLKLRKTPLEMNQNKKIAICELDGRAVYLKANACHTTSPMVMKSLKVY